jgi:predicted PurR-regulated permease PerM
VRAATVGHTVCFACLVMGKVELPSVPPESGPPSFFPGVLRETSEVKPTSRGWAPVVLAIIASVTALSVARAVFIPLAFATMLFFLLRPVVRWLAERHVPRVVGGAVVLGAFTAVLVFAVVELSGPAMEWARRLPGAIRQLEIKSQGLRYPLEHFTRALQAVATLAEVGRSDVPRVDVVRPTFVEGIFAHASVLAAQMGLAGGAAYFLLIDGDTLLRRFFRLRPPRIGDRRSTVVMNEVGASMSTYLGAVTLVNLGLGLSLAALLAVVGMPNPWLWGLLAAILTYVPYVGPTIGIGLVALASFVTFPTLGAGLVPPLIYFGLAVIEGNFVTPLVLGRTLAVRPLVVFVWFAFWAWLWSIPGAILAVPLLMLFKFICDESLRLAAIGYLVRR